MLELLLSSFFFAEKTISEINAMQHVTWFGDVDQKGQTNKQLKTQRSKERATNGK
jgi:hypothetical protein